MTRDELREAIDAEIFFWHEDDYHSLDAVGVRTLTNRILHAPAESNERVGESLEERYEKRNNWPRPVRG